MATTTLTDVRNFIAVSDATVKYDVINNKVWFKNMKDAQTAARMILAAGYSCSYVGGGQPALSVAFDPKTN